MEIIKKNKVLLFLIISFLIISLGSIMSWVLSEQVGMSDNKFFNDSFYPNSNSQSIFSIYPPGLAFISYMFKLIGVSEFLIEFLLVLSSFVLFATIILFYKIIKIRQYNYRFFEVQIIFLMLMCIDYVHYAAEFKPDTIAYLLCFYGLYVFEKHNTVKNIIIGSFLISLSVLFKQQSIFFVFGLILFALLNLKNRKFFYFTSLSSVLYLIVLLILYGNESVFKYNFEILLDDGFRNVFGGLKELWDQFKTLLLFLCVVFPLVKKNSLKFDNPIKKLNNPYFFIGLSILSGSVLSFAKNGGNIGNIQMGIFYCSPFIWLFFKEITFHKITAVIATLILIISVDLGKIEQYYYYYYLKDKVSHFMGNNYNILSDSDHYSIARHLLNKETTITNLETFDLVIPNFNIESINLDEYDIILLTPSHSKRLMINKNLKFKPLINMARSNIYVKKGKQIDLSVDN